MSLVSASCSGPIACHISTPSGVTAKEAITDLRHKMKSCLHVAIYSFNIQEDQLEHAYALLDKIEGHKSMRITYNDDYNFIVKYMPSSAHEISFSAWTMALGLNLRTLSGVTGIDNGFDSVGAATFTLSPRKRKQADTAIQPVGANSPTIIIEVGDLESLGHLQIDARLWLESTLLDVQLVIIICIDPPLPTHPNLPRITIQHWKAFPPDRPLRLASNARQKVGKMDWEADWTHAVTPNYFILLADLFHPVIPPIYGNNDRVVFDPNDVALVRQKIINKYNNP